MPEIKKAAEKPPPPGKARTLTQKVEYQRKYGESKGFCVIG
jgi:hypothetical protein